VLQVENLNVYYGAIHALQGISFDVNEGEIVTLIGANGAGKSTTLRTISGILRSRTGTVRFKGADITTVPAERIVHMGISHVPEGRQLFGPMSVLDNLMLGAYSRRRGDKKNRLRDDLEARLKGLRRDLRDDDRVEKILTELATGDEHEHGGDGH